MTAKFLTRHLGPLLLVALLGLAFPGESRALEVFVRPQGDADVVTVAFSGAPPQSPSVRRTGKTSLTMALGPGVWDRESRPTPSSFGGSALVGGLSVSGNDLVLNLRNAAFGYVAVPVPGRPEVQIHVFRDPIGARWGEPPKPLPAPQRTTSTARSATPAPTRPATPRAAPRPAPKPAPPRPVQSVPAPPSATSPRPAPAQAAGPRPVIEERLEPAAPTGSAQSFSANASAGSAPQRPAFYSVPYSIRAEARNVGPEGAPMMTAARPDEPQADPSRVQAVPAGPVSTTGRGMRVTLGEPATVAASPTAVPEPVRNSVPVPGTEQVARPGASAEGTVAPPPAQVNARGSGGVEGPANVPEATGAVAPPPGAQETASAPEQAPEPASESAPSAESAQAVPDGKAPDGQERKLTPAEQQKVLQGLLNTAETHMANGEYDSAESVLEQMLAQPGLTGDLREDVLYSLAEVYSQLYADDPSGNFDKIEGAYQAAMNANLASPRVPGALLNLGLINLKANNLPEAKAYFNMLATKYPNDPNIPYISLYWGEYHHRRGEYRQAADRFQEVIQKYPDNRRAKDAAYMLADSLQHLGFYDQAYQIVDFIDKRWPVYFVENPDFLRMFGEIEDRLGKLDSAKEHFWTYYNLDPQAADADLVLARIGDIYLRQGNKDAARKIYEKTVADFPDKDGGLISMMRLAEEGIHDAPTLSEMVSVFDRPYNLHPQEAYQKIVAEHPESRLAPLAQLKLGMWYFWNKRYSDALVAAQDLIEKFPKSELVDRAKELADHTFALAVPQLVADGNYPRVVEYWEKYGFGKDYGEDVDDATRLKVALSYWKVGRPDDSLAMLQKYLGPKMVPGSSEPALDMAVSILVDRQAWHDIADLADHVSTQWTLSPRQQRQVDFARAISLENLGQADQSTPLWRKLAADTSVRPGARAYATYYMAKDAQKTQDLQRVFAFAQEALDLLLQVQGDKEKIKDCMQMSIDATERSGRYEEALKWAKEYARYIGEDDPEWPAARFHLAQIYREAGSVKDWLGVLQEIKEKKPDTLYARLATTAMDTYNLERDARNFSNGGN